MDWPSTTTYRQAIADAFDLPLYLSSKEGGFLREMLRDGQPTAPIRFDLPGGPIGTVGGLGPAGTRLRFPQVSANLSQRYCSPIWKRAMAMLLALAGIYWNWVIGQPGLLQVSATFIGFGARL